MTALNIYGAAEGLDGESPPPPPQALDLAGIPRRLRASRVDVGEASPPNNVSTPRWEELWHGVSYFVGH